MLRNDFASLSAIAKPATSELPEDIAALWQRKLADGGLAVVYSGLSYSETVRRIKSGELVDEMESDDYMSAEHPELRVDTIDAIDLDCFRQRPRKRKFEFAQCNLIYGVNGAGKTSLLEGIEAWMCGRHRRNVDVPVPPKCLKVKLHGSTEWQPGPVSDVSLYRQRDHAWYGNYQARKNDLYANFGRFSFFDADAAARLEITNDAREIEHALSHLVLGETATKIAEHISKILPMLQKEERQTSRTIRDAQEAIKAAQDANASLRVPTETRRRAYEKLTEQLQSAGWRAIRRRIQLMGALRSSLLLTG
jgi:DNA repair protein SbcC/Rad50